jgi:hypothetical protein
MNRNKIYKSNDLILMIPGGLQYAYLSENIGLSPAILAHFAHNLGRCLMNS